MAHLPTATGAEPETTEKPAVESSFQIESLSDLVREILIHASRDGFDDEKHWNKSVTRFDGLKIRGLHISKRKKQVRHGFCRKFEAELIQPEETLSLEIRQLPAEKPGAPTQFVITAELKARCDATFAHYIYGVKGLNGSAVADATVRMKVALEISHELSISLDKPFSGFQLHGSVNSVQLKLKDLDLRQFGLIRGDAAELLGDGSREALEQLLQSQERRIKERLQKKLDQIQGTTNN